MKIILPSEAEPIEQQDYVELESGLVVPEWVAEERERQRPKAVDLFCGCGGSSLGMMQAGFHVVGAMDNEPFAVITYMHNLGAYPCEFHFATPEDRERLEKVLQKEMFGKGKEAVREISVSGANRENLGDFPGVEHVFFGDIRMWKGSDILKALGMKRGELDCVAGSPPCQGFTFAGKRQVLDERNSLVFEFARLVVEMLPKTLVFENVPGILHMVTPEGLPVVEKFCRILEDGGFAGVDALQQTLKAQSGSVGMLRGKSPARKKFDPKKKKPRREPIQQRQLFR